MEQRQKNLPYYKSRRPSELGSSDIITADEFKTTLLKINPTTLKKTDGVLSNLKDSGVAAPKKLKRANAPMSIFEALQMDRSPSVCLSPAFFHPAPGVKRGSCQPSEASAKNFQMK